MANIIYAVECGDYSDYRICGLFSTKEKAEEYTKALEWAEQTTYDEPRIIEWTVDDPKISIKSNIVWINQDGTVDCVIKTVNYKPGLFGVTKNYKTGESRLGWVVDTEDEIRAIKVANEKRTQIIAANAWGDRKKIGQLFGVELYDG